MMKKNTVKKTVIILIWLLIWQISAWSIDNSIMLAGPLEVIKALVKNLGTQAFYLVIFNSLAMIFTGFASALIIGIILAVLSYRSRLVEDFLLPLMTAIKSVPVASFVVILLIWFGSNRLSVYISFLIVLPNIYIPTLEGLKHQDKAFKKLAEVSRMSFIDRVKFLYWPAVFPYMITGLKTGIGMAWKSGVAAEVIGISKNTLGERIYVSKVYLETADLFAWTLTVILLSFLFEKLILKLVNRLGTLHFTSRGSKLSGTRDLPVFDKVTKCFNEDCLFMDLTINFSKSDRFFLLAPSGFGKTTVLNLLMGFESPDRGLVKKVPVSVAFQEEVFLDEYTALENLRIFAKESISLKEIEDLACRVLPWESLCKPVKEFSGGMKRRLSVLRALLMDSSILLLDEPFSGLDEDNKQALAGLIDLLLDKRILLYTGHYEEDAALLGAERINLWKPE